MSIRKENKTEAMTGEAGFSTLEAVIAVGILALCVLPLMDFQQTVAEGAAKLSRSNRMLAANEQAESFLRALPAESLAEGAVSFGTIDLTWQEVARGESHPALSDAGAPGRFGIALITLGYEVVEADQILGRGSIERLVWTANVPFLDQEFSSGF